MNRLLCCGKYKNNMRLMLIQEGNKVVIRVEAVPAHPRALPTTLDVPPWLNPKGGDRPCRTGTYQ